MLSVVFSYFCHAIDYCSPICVYKYWLTRFVEKCSADHGDCQTIWSSDVRQLYSQLVSGTLDIGQLNTVCRCVVYSRITATLVIWPKLTVLLRRKRKNGEKYTNWADHMRFADVSVWQFGPWTLILNTRRFVFSYFCHSKHLCQISWKWHWCFLRNRIKV